MKFDRRQYVLLKQAVNALSSVCDGAEARDGRGFDGRDTRAGHLYAFLPLDAWPLSAFHRAWSWTKKYHQQLERMQMDCADLPEPPLFEGEDRQIALLPDRAGFFVIFPYDEALTVAFRRIPGQALHTVPIGTSTVLCFRYRTVQAIAGVGGALLAFADVYHFQLGPEVLDLATECDSRLTSALLETALHEYRIEAVVGNAPAFALFFPRIPALNEEVKRIPGRSPSYAGGFHWVIPAIPHAAAALLSFVERHPQFFVATEVKERLEVLVLSQGVLDGHS